jgi:hypothetical protein
LTDGRAREKALHAVRRAFDTNFDTTVRLLVHGFHTDGDQRNRVSLNQQIPALARIYQERELAFLSTGSFTGSMESGSGVSAE